MIKPTERETTTFTFRFEKAPVQNEVPTERNEERPADEMPPTPSVPKITLLLALAHHMERQLSRGAVRSQKELAARMGITGARVTQIMNMTLLAPEIQEEMLFNQNQRITERCLRRSVGSPLFQDQRRLWPPAS